MAEQQRTSFRPATKQVRTPAVADGARTARLRQRVGAAALILSPLFLAGSIFCYAWATRSGGDDYTGANAMELYIAHPQLVVASVTCVLLGCLLMVPAMMAAMRLLRPGSPRLSMVGGSMMVLGYCCYVYAVANTSMIAAMAEDTAHQEAYAAIIDAADSGLALGWPFLVFVVGNILGALLLAISMLRSRVVHWWAAVALACWPVSHVIGLSAGSEWFEAAGSVLQLAGLTALALAVLRIPPDRWDTA